MTPRTLLCLAAFTVASASHAAGFDCTQAKLWIEHRICNNPELSQLDDTLTSQYGYSFNNAADQHALELSEKQWLRSQRNHCTTDNCVSTEYQMRIDALKQAPAANWSHYHNGHFGLSFDYFGNGKIKACADTDNCLELDYRLADGSRQQVQFTLVDDSLENVAVTRFNHDDGSWSMGDTPVSALTQHGLVGLGSGNACPNGDTFGYQRGSASCVTTVLSNGRRSVIIADNGVFNANLQRTLASVQLTRQHLQ